MNRPHLPERRHFAARKPQGFGCVIQVVEGAHRDRQAHSLGKDMPYRNRSCSRFRNCDRLQDLEGLSNQRVGSSNLSGRTTFRVYSPGTFSTRFSECPQTDSR
jgi:hypothetical protein